MNKFILGFVAGAATYHYVSGGFNNKELVTELRHAIKRLDERLAETEKGAPSAPEKDAPSTPTEEPQP